MFSLFKSGPKLKSIIPPGFVDIHSHLLPSIDDGSESDEETVDLVKNLQSLGISACITTPHVIHSVWENSSAEILKKEEHTVSLLKDHDIHIPFSAAAEYLMDSFFVELLQREKLLTLKDNYILVEMSYINPPIKLEDILYEIRINDYIPILAHPERYLYYHRNPESFKKLKKQGCLFQLNLFSTIGYYGKGIVAMADRLLKENMYDFCGTDIHKKRHLKNFEQEIICKNIRPLENALNANISVFKT